MLTTMLLRKRARRCLVATALLLWNVAGYTQQVDIEAIREKARAILKNKKPFKFSGGINASSVFYNGNAGSGRDPFSYVLSGNFSVNIFNSVTIPLSFTLTNRGHSYNYRFPTFPNRLSLHPKFKSVTGHIGDVAMTFSPYTLSGIQFRGVGADYTPKGSKWRYSGMYGILQRAVQMDSTNGNTQAAYKRTGMGAKVSYDQGANKIAFSVFHAKDNLNSLVVKPDSLQIFPMQNLAMSVEGSVKLRKNLILSGEYGLSALTRDLRAPKRNDSASVNLITGLLGGRLSTYLYKALKSQLSYQIGSSMIGLGYERIDPGFQTLGAYYFNNDLENITVNFAQALFKGKVNISGNVGYQRDDLDKKKAGGSTRQVAAVNLNWVPGKRITTSMSYSNFSTFTNVKPQFQYINQLTPFDNLDTLDFRQLSQNANININYVVSTNKDKPQNLNVNLSFQDSYDEQGGTVSKGNSSQFFNLAATYSYTSVPKSMNISGALNATYNTVGAAEIIMLGPTINVSKQLFDKKVRTGASVSYNTTLNNNVSTGKVMSFRMNAGYVFRKKHNFTLSGVGMLNSIPNKPMRRDISVTTTYSYNFSF